MKTRLLIIAGLLLTSFQLKARHANAIFKTENGAPMIVFLDGNRINEYPSEVVRLNKIYPGKHYVRIKVIGKRFNREISRRIYLRRDFKTKFLINSYGRRRNLDMVKVYEKPLPYYTEVPRRNQNRGHYKYKDYRGVNYELVNIDRLMRGLKQRRFDNERVYFTKSALSRRSLYAEDLLRILNHLTFESNKVEIADFAYSRVVDKENFYIVYDAFRFQSSIRQLNKNNYDDTWF